MATLSRSFLIHPPLSFSTFYSERKKNENERRGREKGRRKENGPEEAAVTPGLSIAFIEIYRRIIAFMFVGKIDAGTQVDIEHKKTDFGQPIYLVLDAIALIVNGPEVVSKFVGETEKNVRDLFAHAEEDQKSRGRM
ncbi:hypothetical protein L1887_31905 [Cichorium endivia]|nr:hypothetical protein L1887_31905 [Cichorium endivia]